MNCKFINGSLEQLTLLEGEANGVEKRRKLKTEIRSAHRASEQIQFPAALGFSSVPNFTPTPLLSLFCLLPKIAFPF